MHSTLIDKIYHLKKTYYYKLLLLLFLLLVIIALFVAFQHYFILEPNSKQHFSLKWHIPFNLFYWLFWFFISPLIYFLVKKYDKNKFMNYFILYFIAPLILVGVHQVVSAVIINTILDYLDIQTLIYRRILRNQWLWVDIIIYFIIAVGIYIAESLEENKKDEIKLWQLKTSITQSQINILRSQIHPHFLFNTFNTLSTLILKGERTIAIKLINSVKDLLNKSIEDTNHSLIPLDKELNFVINYLNIEKLRFGEKLTIEIDINDNTKNALVPNFILQPLVENSIRHGISKQLQNGIIKISTKKENEYLIITVEDNGPGLMESYENYFKKGLGLNIIQKQLKYFFDDNFAFELMKSSIGGLKVYIKIPFYSENHKKEKLNEILQIK